MRNEKGEGTVFCWLEGEIFAGADAIDVPKGAEED